MQDLKSQHSDFAEVIVVDGGSQDSTATFIQQNHPWVKCVSYKKGVAIQRNYGASLSRSNTLIFLDADTHVPADTIATLNSKFFTNKLSLACPLFFPITEKPWIRALFYFLNIAFLLLQKLLPSGAGPCLIIDKELFLTNGGFRSIPFEDMELIRRLAKKSKYAILKAKIYVSDRRMRKDGFFKTIATYSYLCAVFTLGNFRAAARIKYPFGHHSAP